jgi:hypothetical protein
MKKSKGAVNILTIKIVNNTINVLKPESHHLVEPELQRHEAALTTEILKISNKPLQLSQSYCRLGEVAGAT